MGVILSTQSSTGPNWRSANLSLPRTRIPLQFRAALAGVGFHVGPGHEATVVEPEQRSAGPNLRSSFDDWYYKIHVLPPAH